MSFNGDLFEFLRNDKFNQELLCADGFPSSKINMAPPSAALCLAPWLYNGRDKTFSSPRIRDPPGDESPAFGTTHGGSAGGWPVEPRYLGQASDRSGDRAALSWKYHSAIVSLIIS